MTAYVEGLDIRLDQLTAGLDALADLERWVSSAAVDAVDETLAARFGARDRTLA